MNADESAPAAGVDETGTDQTGTEGAQPTPPVLRVVSGNPTAEEIAALVAVLAAASGGSDESATAGPRRSLWNDSTRAPGHRLAPGPGTWRASARPRL